MFRVYDKEEKRWIDERVYLSNYGEIYTGRQSAFGGTKLNRLIPDDRYTWQRNTELADKDGRFIYEGDIIEAGADEEDKMIALVAYIPDMASFAALDYEHYKYYPLNKEASELIQVVGNVFDTPELLPEPEEVVS